MEVRSATRRSAWFVSGLLVISVVQPLTVGPAAAEPTSEVSAPTFSTAVAFDTSRPVSEMARAGSGAVTPGAVGERGSAVPDSGFRGDGAVQSRAGTADDLSAPIRNFEGASNLDNPFKVSPPDPNGDVGPNHYVEMVNLTFSIYTKTGRVLTPPTPLGELWAGFEVEDCTDLSGDPIVLHDQLADRWILTQFSTRGPEYFNCVALSTTADPTGTYYRYAFSTGRKFPDYPKYGVWPDAYYISTREFGRFRFSGVGAYAVDRARMLAGDPNAGMVMFNVAPRDKPWLPGDGLLPSDLDGNNLPPGGSPNFFVGTQDDEGPYGAPFDAINIWQFHVKWRPTLEASFFRSAQLPTREFDSSFPCGEDGRSCIEQPVVAQKIDILSYRQRPTWRAAYRNFGSHQSIVTNQSVQARPGEAGVRWYEIRRPHLQPVLYQQGTYAPDDGVNRWMGSVAMDKFGNMAAGYSVSNGDRVFPGIRYTGRLASDPRGQLPQAEQVLIDGSGSQRGSPRWGDYTSMNVDPTDDCTFWYVNEYYERTLGQVLWQTRIGSFRFQGCRG